MRRVVEREWVGRFGGSGRGVDLAGAVPGVGDGIELTIDVVVHEIGLELSPELGGLVAVEETFPGTLKKWHVVEVVLDGEGTTPAGGSKDATGGPAEFDELGMHPAPNDVHHRINTPINGNC